MKVGILTFHRAINYGAVLQCYALQETVRALGHDAWVIDYRQPKVEATDRAPLGLKGLWRMMVGLHLRGTLHYRNTSRTLQARRARWDAFLSKHLHLTAPCGSTGIPQDFDAYIVGSDQVLNSAICWGLDPVYWGGFTHPAGSRIITYAASTSVKDLAKHEKADLQSCLANFHRLSFREASVTEHVNELFHPVPSSVTVLDPTLTADPAIWDALAVGEKIQKEENYVLYFAARNYNPNPDIMQQKASILAKRLGCDVRRIAFGEDSPEQFVNKFRHARAVLTSSYHGVMFSLIFRRPLLAVCYGDEQDARYVDLLTSLGAASCLMKADDEIPDNLVDNYDTIEHNLKDLRPFSLNYLNSALK